MFSVLIASVAMHGATAQDPAVLERNLRQLDALRRQAGVAAVHAERERSEALDTIRAGALLILVRPQDAENVRRGAELAWPKLDSLYGEAAATLASRPMLFWFLERRTRTLPEYVTKVEAVVGDSGFTREDVARQLTNSAAKLLRQSADTELSNWLGPLLVPASQGTAEPARIYVELVTAPSAAVRRCYEGDAASCRAALGLLDGGDRVTMWFNAAERRALVKRTTVMERAPVRSAADACLLAQSEPGCSAVLRTLPYLDPPLSVEARHSFARAALAAGGPAAYGRLIRSVGRPLSERFAIAAGLPADSLAWRWRAAILAARPKTVTLAALSGWAALGWVVVFGLLALRSTRWR